LSRQRKRRKRCHGRDVRRRKHTAARRRRETDKVVCLFFIYRCGVCRHVPFFLFFFCSFFLTNLKWPKAVWAETGRWTPDHLRPGARRMKPSERIWALDPRLPLRPGERERGEARCTPNGLRPWARRAGFFFFFEQRSMPAPSDTMVADRYRDPWPRWTPRLIGSAQRPRSWLFF
jgi:hypothetical protein